MKVHRSSDILQQTPNRFSHSASLRTATHVEDRVLHERRTYESVLAILSCLLVLQLSCLGWNVDRWGPSLLLVCSALAGWFFRQGGVSYSTVITSFGLVLLHVMNQDLFAVTSLTDILRAALLSGASSQLACLMRSQCELVHTLASVDPLTGLLNLKRFKELVEAKVSGCRNGQCALSIALIDCDHFKDFNDTHGHLAGDEFLIKMSQRIVATLVEGEFAARWGGDEFVVCYMSDEPELIPRVKNLQSALSASEHATLARTSEESGTTKEMLITSKQNSVKDLTSEGMTWSVGIASFSRPEPAVEMIRLADQAMYTAKNSGPGRIHFVTAEKPEESKAR